MFSSSLPRELLFLFVCLLFHNSYLRFSGNFTESCFLISVSYRWHVKKIGMHFSIKLMNLLHLISASLLVQHWPLMRYLQVFRVLYGLIYFSFLMKNCHIMYFDYVFLSHPVLPRSFPAPCPYNFGFILFTSFNTKMQNKNPIFQNSTTLNVSYHMWPCMLLKITPLILWLRLIYKVLHINISIPLNETTLLTVTGSS